MSFLREIIRRSDETGVDGGELALSIDDANFIVDPSDLTGDYDDGDPVTSIDTGDGTFTADAAHAPTLVDDGGNWVLRFDGSEYMEGPADMLNGQSSLWVVAVVRVDQLAHLSGSGTKRAIFGHSANTENHPSRPTRYSLTHKSFESQDEGPRLASRRTQDEADGQDMPKIDISGGALLQGVDQIVDSCANFSDGVCWVGTDRDRSYQDAITTGVWPDNGDYTHLGSRPLNDGSDDQHFAGDLVLLAGFWTAPSDDERDDVYTDAANRYQRSPSITLTDDDPYADLWADTSPDDFAQFRYATYAGHTVLFRDADATRAVTDPGRHLIKAVKNPFTGELILTLADGDAPLWMGPHLGAYFRGGHLTGASPRLQADDYGDNDRTSAMALTIEQTSNLRYFQHARPDSNAGWGDQLDNWDSNAGTVEILHSFMGSGKTAGVTVGTDTPIVAANSYTPSGGVEIWVDGNQELSDASLDSGEFSEGTGSAGIASDHDGGEYLQGYIESLAWYQRVLSTGEHEQIGDEL